MKKEIEKRGKGQPKKIPDAQTLYKWFEMYKLWSAQNPIKKMDFKGSNVEEVNYKLTRPLTWVGFSVWLYKNKTVSNIDEYKANKDNIYSEYSSIIRVISSEIYQQQYDGAAVGIFQHNIIARKLGLVDKTDVKQEITVKETKIGFENE